MTETPQNYLMPTWRRTTSGPSEEYEFYCNYYLQDSNVWQTVAGGSAGGTDFANWLAFQAADDNKIHPALARARFR